MWSNVDHQQLGLHTILHFRNHPLEVYTNINQDWGVLKFQLIEVFNQWPSTAILLSKENIGWKRKFYFFAKTSHWGVNLYCCAASWLAWWWLTAGVGGLCFVLLCTFRLFLVLNCLPQSSQATTSPTCVSMWFLMFCLTWPSLPQTRHCSSPLSVCPVRLSIFLSSLAAYPSGSSSWPIRCKISLQSRPVLKLYDFNNFTIVTCIWQMRLFPRLKASERQV